LLSFLKRNKYQIIKFGITGILSSALNFLVYFTIYNFLKNANIASFLGYFVGLINSFLFSKNWVFYESKTIKSKKAFVIICLIYVLGAFEMTLLINLGIYLFSDYILAWLIGAGTAAINNYLGSKFLLFKD